MSVIINPTGGGGAGGPPFLGATKAGTPTAADVPVGYWTLIRDTVNATTGLYYNNGGVLQVVYLANAGVPPAYVPTYPYYGF